MNNIKLSAIHSLDAEAKASQPKPPSWVLDKIADEKMSGGYSNKLNPICNKCFIRKSSNGSCSCN